MSRPQTEHALETLDSAGASKAERLAAAREIAAAGIAQDLDSVCEVDLHCHSFMSDGYRSPAAKVFEAWRRRMKALAISDHDLFDGQEEALEAGSIFGIEVIGAAEFYTDRPGVEIIAHFPDSGHFLKTLRSGVFDEVVEPIRNAKSRQLSCMLGRVPECMMRHGLKAEITNADIASFVRNGITTKGDISVIMWQKYGDSLKPSGIASDVKDFQARYTTKDSELNVPLELDMDISAEAFIRRILSWGGIPGLSHPTELRSKESLGNESLKELIWSLAGCGLQSIEVDGWRNRICPESGLQQTDLFDGMRKDWNASHPDMPPLLFTNGSDDHNQPGEGLELGCGRDRNLRPEFGRHSAVEALRERQRILLSSSLTAS